MTTSTVKHTPGPWTAKWSKYRDGVFIVQAGMPANRVLAQFDGDGDGPDGQSIADANLIAAAPDLLEALRKLELAVLHNGDWEDGCFYHNGTSAPELQSPLDAARAAISKATGSPAPQEKGGE